MRRGRERQPVGRRIESVDAKSTRRERLRNSMQDHGHSAPPGWNPSVSALAMVVEVGSFNASS